MTVSCQCPTLHLGPMVPISDLIKLAFFHFPFIFCFAQPDAVARYVKLAKVQIDQVLGNKEDEGVNLCTKVDSNTNWVEFSLASTKERIKNAKGERKLCLKCSKD